MLTIKLASLRTLTVFGNASAVAVVFLLVAVSGQAPAQERIRDESGKAVGFRYVGNESETCIALKETANPNDVLEIFLGRHKVTEEEIQLLQRYSELDTLTIGGFPDDISQVSTAALREIGRLGKLLHLELNVECPADVDWSILRHAKLLRSLTITGQAKFSDADMDAIASLARLKNLRLAGDFSRVQSFEPLKNNNLLSNIALNGELSDQLVNELFSTDLKLSQLELPAARVTMSQLRDLAVMSGECLQLLTIGFSNSRCFSVIEKFNCLDHLTIVMPDTYSLEISNVKLPQSLLSLVIRSE